MYSCRKKLNRTSEVWPHFLAQYWSINSYKTCSFFDCCYLTPTRHLLHPPLPPPPKQKEKNAVLRLLWVIRFSICWFNSFSLPASTNRKGARKSSHLAFLLDLLLLENFDLIFRRVFKAGRGIGGWMLCQDLVTWTVKYPLCRSVVIFDPHLLRVEASGQQADPRDACFKTLKCLIRLSDGFISPRRRDFKSARWSVSCFFN